MKNKNKSKRFGIFYRSHGKWTTNPYAGMTFTEYQLNRNPYKTNISTLKNYILKSRIQLKPV